MLSTALLLLLSQADAGTDAGPAPYSTAIYGSCPTAGEEVAPAVPVAPFLADGGADWLLPHPRGPRIACLLAACESMRFTQEERLDASMSSAARSALLLSIGASVAVSVAAGVVWVRDELQRPRAP